MNLYIINLIVTIIIAFVLKIIKNKEKRNKVFLYCSFIQLFLFLGLRAIDVGIDLKNYFLLYDQCKGYSLSSALNINYEKAYIIYTYFISRVIDDKQIFLIITAFITLIGQFYVIKKYSKNYFLSVFIFMTFQFYIYNFYLLRQAIALSILLLSIKFIEERKLFIFLLMITLATLFHTSAFLFVIIYFLYDVKIDSKKLLIIFGTIVAITLFGDYILNLIFKYIYSEYELRNNLGGGYSYFIILMFILIIATLVKKKLFIEEKNNILWYNILVVSILIQTLALKLSIASRMNIYYTFSLVIIIPNMLNIFKDKKIKDIGQILVMFLLIIFFIISIQNTTIYQPYHFFWD